jgi:hypothetical protein
MRRLTGPTDDEFVATVNQIIGRALSPFADDIVIGNKVGASRDPAGWLTDSRPESTDSGRGCVARHARRVQSAYLLAFVGRQPGAGERAASGRAARGSTRCPRRTDAVAVRWAVPDSATMLFMAVFHHFLDTGDRDAARALSVRRLSLSVWLSGAKSLS